MYGQMVRTVFNLKIVNQNQLKLIQTQLHLKQFFLCQINACVSNQVSLSNLEMIAWPKFLSLAYTYYYSN